MTDNKETYLGDGLYASFDGFQIKLRAPRDELVSTHGTIQTYKIINHEVYLDHKVFAEFIKWCSQNNILKLIDGLAP